jgi:hypothetical protein
VLAKRLDRFRQIQLATIDGEPFGRKQLSYIHGRNRTVEDFVFADLAVHLNHDLRKLLSERFGILPFQRLAAHGGGFFLFNLFHVGRRGQHSKLLRQKVVAGIARTNGDDIATHA